MKKLLLFFKLILLYGLMFCYGCASVSSRSTTLQKSARPMWVDNHPLSRTHFIGIGSSQIGKDLYGTQRQARDRALNDIAQQINVTIMSDISLHDNVVTIDDKSINVELLNENIATITEAVLSEWEEVRTWHSPEGYFWSKVVLSKKKYYEKVNRKINDAIDKVCDIIRYSHQGSARQRIHSLYKGFEILDALSGTELKGIVNGREVVLNNELHRCIAKVLESIVVTSNEKSVTLSSTQSIPENLGVNIFYSGEDDSSLAVVWTASHHSVDIATVSRQAANFYPASISSLSPSTGSVTITATVDFGKMTYDLMRRKFVLPNGSFTIRRKKAPFYVDRENTFSRTLANELSNRSSIVVVDNISEAEYLLTSDFVNENKSTLQNSIYVADAELTLTLVAKDGNRIIDLNKKVRAADGISALRAIENTQRYALDIAVKQVEMIF